VAQTIIRVQTSTESRRPSDIHEYALNLLAARAYTRRGLEKKFASKGFGPEEIAREIESLQASRLIDDEKFAREYARQKLTSGGKSVRRVHLELTHKGISAAHAREAIETVLDEENIDTMKSLRAAGEKKLATMHGLDKETKRKRLVAFLARRGFEIDDIRRFVGDTLK
jgi:regulatory protein